MLSSGTIESVSQLAPAWLRLRHVPADLDVCGYANMEISRLDWAEYRWSPRPHRPGHFRAHSQHRGYQQIQVFPSSAVISEIHSDALAPSNASCRRGSNAILLQPEDCLSVQVVQILF